MKAEKEGVWISRIWVKWKKNLLPHFSSQICILLFRPRSGDTSSSNPCDSFFSLVYGKLPVLARSDIVKWLWHYVRWNGGAESTHCLHFRPYILREYFLRHRFWHWYHDLFAHRIFFSTLCRLKSWRRRAWQKKVSIQAPLESRLMRSQGTSHLWREGPIFSISKKVIFVRWNCNIFQFMRRLISLGSQEEEEAYLTRLEKEEMRRATEFWRGFKGTSSPPSSPSHLCRPSPSLREKKFISHKN